MSKKILVTKEWHTLAMEAIQSQYENTAFVKGLEMFVLTKLTPVQQKELEAEVEDWVNHYEK